MTTAPHDAPGSASYAAVLERTAAIVEDLDAERAAARVPACPGWTVADTLAHLAGGASDIAAGNVADAGSDAWTAAQVEARRGVPVPELIAEWRRAAPAFAPILDLPPGGPGGQIVMDALTHELDLRAALGAPGRPEEADLRHALGFAGKQFGKHLRKTLGLPPVLARTDAGDWPLGLGEPALVLDLDAVDLLRSITGRRTWEQLAAQGWPEEYRPAFTWAVFRLPDAPTEPSAR